MIFRKKNNKIDNNTKYDIFNDPSDLNFSIIDLGEELFTISSNHNVINSDKPIPELLDLDVNQIDKEIYTMSNLSYPDDIKYVNKKYQREKFKRFNKIRRTKKALTLVLILSFMSLGFVGYEIFKWQKDNMDTKEQIDEINEEVKIEEVNKSLTEEEKNLPNDYFDFQNIDMLNVDFSSLLKRNSDTVGWIKVEGTKINYPFVHTDNNDYYLGHSFNKKKNDAGWVFLDYRNDINNMSKNTIIYGHGRLNNTMFGSLKKIVNKNWYSNKSNQIVRISTPIENSVWQVFSTYTIKPESYYIMTDFNDNQNYTDFINKLKSRSVYNYGVDVTSNDYILTLSSCYNDEKRVVLHAKLISKVAR